MSQLITPRTLKGFRDYPPALMIPRERLLDQARRVYRSYGFAPIDTPALEHAEILLGKGGEESDKIIYRFTDHGRRDVALRFDLTVPFARFAAENIGSLGVPFKRYAMGPVWRGENTGHGRFREFWQCDFDVIGTTANAADIEVVLVINDLMRAIGFERFQIRINNRRVLNGVLEALGVGGKIVPILRALDKFDKIGREGVFAELTDQASNRAGLKAGEAETVLALTTAFKNSTTEEIFKSLLNHVGTDTPGGTGLRDLDELFGMTKALGIPPGRVVLDPSICRGLDYYTGTIYETFLLDLPGIGSVCSGGRYDNLAGLYTKQKLPGVGASLGVDRLLAAMEELQMLPKTSTPAPVLIVQFSADRLADYLKMAARLRAEGFGVEVFPEAKKIGQQLKYADQRGFRVALIAGGDEFARGEWKIKNLATHEETTVGDSGVADALRGLLAQGV